MRTKHICADSIVFSGKNEQKKKRHKNELTQGCVKSTAIPHLNNALFVFTNHSVEVVSQEKSWR